MSARDPSNDGSTTPNGTGTRPRLPTRSVQPQRFVFGGRVVLTRNGEEAETIPASEPPGTIPASEPPETIPASEPPRAEPRSPAQVSDRRNPPFAGVPSAPAGANPVAAAATDGAGRPEWSSIVFAPLPHGGEFHVLTVEQGGRRKVVGRSEPFAIPLWSHILPVRRLLHFGAPRRAHDQLVERLIASGWQQMPTRGRWHDTALVRTRPRPRRGAYDRIVIGCRREGATARFYAEALDDYGNATPVGQSRPFSISPWSVGLRPTDDARAAHEQLLEQLSCEGWTTAGELSSKWYARVLSGPEASH